MLPGMVGGPLGTTYFIGSATGNYYDDAKQRGMTEEQATMYSGVMGIIEGSLEAVGANLTTNVGKQLLKKNIKGALVDYGLDIGENFLEESIVEPLSEIVATTTAGKDKSDWNNIGQRMLESGVAGAITSAITGGISGTIGTVRSTKTSNEQKVYNNEVKTRTDEKLKQATIEQTYNEQIQTQENLGLKITEDLKAEIMQKVEKAYDNGTLKTIELSKKDLMKIEEQVEKDMQEGNISAENIMKTLGENHDLSKDNLLMKSMYENEQKYNSYEVEQTDNEKVNILMQSAADAGMNNTSKTRKKVELISKLVKETNRQYKFISPEQLKEMGYNENANGLINKSTGEILINAHSDKGLQSIVGHETTHIFDGKDKDGQYSKEYQKLQNMAIEYAKVKGIYDSKVQSITSAYGDLLVDESQIKEELTADLVGDFLFNDEKFIENLAVKDRNVFQKIYDYIKHIYKVATSGTDEAKALENLKYQFDKVYKTISEESNSETKYSIGGKEALKNIKDSQLKKEAYDSYKKAMKMAKNKESNEKIFKETGWYKDKVTGKMKFNFSDKDMKIVNRNYKVGQIFNLEEMLVHDTLFEMYPQLRAYKVKIEDMNQNKTNSNGKLNGRYNKYTNEITLDINRFKNISNVDGTLIHEIQHAIQKIEGFANGASIKFGKEQYQKSPGEIEARDTTRRMVEEKYKGKDLSDIIPKSEKADATILEKMKIALYNYFSSLSNEVESDESIEINSKEGLSDNSEDNRLVLGRTSRDNGTDRTFGNRNVDITRKNGEKVQETDSKLQLQSKEIKKEIYENEEKNNRKIWNNRIDNNIQESENNSGSFSFDKNAKRYEDLLSSNTINYNKRSNGLLNIEMFNDDELINQITVASKEEIVKQLGKNLGNYIYENVNEASQTLDLTKQEIEKNKPLTHKEKQLEIIKKTNPMLDDYHTGIRNVEDIKTFEETINDDESFSWGDFSKEDAKNALKKGKITVYSSYPIKQGTFISTSKIQAEEYAGGRGNKVYSKTISLDDVAWINGDEGQYAKIDTNGKLSKTDNQGRVLSKEQQQYFKDSKARDENGNLLEVYHGTKEDFTEFDISYLGSASGDVGFLGDGFYLATHRGEAKYYGNKIMNGYVNIKNPYNIKELSKYNGKIFNGEDSSSGLHIKNLVELNPQWRNIEINNTTYGEIADEVTNYLKNVKVKKLGIVEDSYGNDSGIMWEISFEGQKTQDESILNYTEEEVIANGLNRHIKNEFGHINNSEIIQYITEENRFNKDIKTLREVLQEKGYDSIVQGNPQTTDEIVIFDSNQFKNVDNANPTSNPDIRFSMTNDTEIIGDDIAVKDMLVQQRSTIEDEVVKTKERILDTNIENNDKEDINNKKISFKELQDKYKLMEVGKRQYEKLLRKDKPTEKEKITVDRLLKGEIENNEIPASVNRQRVVDLYNAKAKFYSVEQEIKTQRKAITKSYRDLAKNMIKNISTWKDKKMGIQYQINTMKRNLRDIIPDKSEADSLYNEYFKPITKNNATIEKEISKYNDRISKYEINNVESQYIQMIGENKYNPDTKLPLEKIEEFYDKNKSKIDINKCQEAVEEFRNIYDELIVKINDVLIENGYKPIEYRKGYFPHFVENKASSILGKFAEKLGWKINADTLPTDISGITDQFKPGKAWTAFSQQRKGDETDYNALKGFDNYIRGAMDVIHHTKDIQKLRALENEIRYQYSEKGIQEQIDNIYEDHESSIEEKQKKINEIFENTKNNPMGFLATELRDYTNNLANKKATADRGLEHSAGRQTYSIMTNIQNRVSANMVGANISSAMTNFIPITQAWSQTSTKNMMKAIKDSISVQFKDDGFSNESTFLTNRTKQADRLYKTGLDKANDKLGYMFDIVDSFTSNVIVRAKYYDNIDAGMNTYDALDNADEFAKDVIAGRSKGDMPTIFNQKNPLAKLFTAFQLEVNNQYGYMLKDMPADFGDEAKEKLVGAFVKMFLGAFLYNMIFEKITGNKSAFSPIDIALDSYNTLSNDDISTGDKIKTIGTDLVGETPFLGGIAGGGRLPIQGAIPYDDPLSMVLETVSTASNVFDGDEEQKQTAIKSLAKEWSKPLYYVALPFAGGQLKKTIEGASMYLNDVPGSYTNSGDLRFTVDDDIGSKVKATILGTYANPYAQDYIDSGFKTISKDNIDEMVGLDMNSSEYRQFKSNLNKSSNTLDKNGYKLYVDSNSKVYWYNSDSKTMYDSDYNKTTLTEDDLTKVSKTEEALNYINSLDLTDAQKNIAANNLNKNAKKTIDMSEYGNYSSYNEYKYARDNPEKYSVVTQITDYDSYVKYKDDIADIKKKYSTEAGYKSQERRTAVHDYIDNLNLNVGQKLMLEKMAGGYSVKNYQNYIYEYLEQTDLTSSEKYAIWEELFD